MPGRYKYPQITPFYIVDTCKVFDVFDVGHVESIEDVVLSHKLLKIGTLCKQEVSLLKKLVPKYKIFLKLNMPLSNTLGYLLSKMG